MKINILSAFGMGILLLTNLHADKTEYKFRDIATIGKGTLGFQIVFKCATSLSALRSLYFLFANRDDHGDLHDNNLVVHGPDSVFLYAATKYPSLRRLLPTIFNSYTQNMAGNINEKLLDEFLSKKRDGEAVVITYGDDIDVLLRLRDELKKKSWSDEKIDEFLDNVIIKVHNSDDVISYFKAQKEAAALDDDAAQAFKDALDKKVNPKEYVPAGYNWTFERVSS